MLKEETVNIKLFNKAYKKQLITKLEFKVLKGQVLKGDNAAALKGYSKLINRKMKTDSL